MSDVATPTAQQVDEAIDWLVKFETGAITAEDRFEFERWYGLSPQHQLAWQRVGFVSKPVESPVLKSVQVMHSLSVAEQHMRNRRRLLGNFASVSGIGLTLWLTRDYTGVATAGGYLYGQTFADITTAAGEQKSALLADGGKLLVNTRSAVDINFAVPPELTLHYGELAITASGGAQVQAGEHRFQPLAGTEFTLYREDNYCHLQVISGQVTCVAGDQRKYSIPAGQALLLTKNRSEQRLVIAHSLSWREGFISAQRMTLGDFTAQLARYRAGFLGCDPSVASLTLSGGFPLKNTDAILDNLCQILPVRQQRISRYWVRLLPA